MNGGDAHGIKPVRTNGEGRGQSIQKGTSMTDPIASERSDNGVAGLAHEKETEVPVAAVATVPPPLEALSTGIDAGEEPSSQGIDKGPPHEGMGTTSVATNPSDSERVHVRDDGADLLVANKSDSSQGAGESYSNVDIGTKGDDRKQNNAFSRRESRSSDIANGKETITDVSKEESAEKIDMLGTNNDQDIGMDETDTATFQTGSSALKIGPKPSESNKSTTQVQGRNHSEEIESEETQSEEDDDKPLSATGEFGPKTKFGMEPASILKKGSIVAKEKKTSQKIHGWYTTNESKKRKTVVAVKPPPSQLEAKTPPTSTLTTPASSSGLIVPKQSNAEAIEDKVTVSSTASMKAKGPTSTETMAVAVVNTECVKRKPSAMESPSLRRKLSAAKTMLLASGDKQRANIEHLTNRASDKTALSKIAPADSIAAKELGRSRSGHRKKSSKSLKKAANSQTASLTTKSGVGKHSQGVATSKASGRRTGVPEIWSGPPNEPLEGGWPKGWIKRVFVRQSGASKSQEDRYWYPPESQTNGKVHKLRSMKEVERYLVAFKATNDANKAWDARKG
jgi:hypothetical protein